MNVMRIYPASFVLSMRAALTSASVAVAADYTWAGAQGGKWRLPIIEQAFETEPLRAFSDRTFRGGCKCLISNRAKIAID